MLHALDRTEKRVEGGVLESLKEPIDRSGARLGKALRRDFGGELDLKYALEDKFATASWSREAV